MPKRRSDRVIALFSDGLRRARVRAGLTQEEASYRLGCDRSVWSLFENARRDPRLTTAERAAQAVGASIRDVLKAPAPQAGTRNTRRKRS